MDYEYIFQRRHPFYQRNRSIWERSKAAYSGGESYIDLALIRHVSEIELEFGERRRRAYYFNYPRKIARLITQYVFGTDPARDRADLELVEDFSRDGMRANEVMRQFSTLLNVYGSAWLMVEMPAFTGNVDAARKHSERLRPYVYTLSPLQVVDWSIAGDGQLGWVLVEENGFDNADPFRDPVSTRRRRLWTRNEWQLFEQDNATGRALLAGSGHHALGRVPALHACEADGYGLAANHWFEDAVRISDAILNNESEAQMNVVKQLFGLLVIAENFARQGRESAVAGNAGNSTEKFSHVLARSAAIWETPEERGISRYIAPSGAETAQIREENQSLKRELFDVIGLTLRPEVAIRQTAEAKAWDYQSTRQFLACRVDLLEQVEMQAWELMRRWDPTIPIPEVSYNRDFSILDLKSLIDGLLNLSRIDAGDEYRREIARTALGLLEKYQKISPERRQEILNDLEHTAIQIQGGGND